MTLRIVFRRPAKSEFEDAVVRYDEQRPAAPDRYPIIFGDVRRTVARRFPFSVYFRIRRDSMVVLAIFYGRRDPAIWQRRV